MARSHPHLRCRVWAHFDGRCLDSRLAAGEDPLSDPALACRAGQLLSRHTRRKIVSGLGRVLSERPERTVFSSAVSCNWRAVEVARPALEQLARAIGSRESIQPRGVALTQVLLTEPCSALYRPAYTDELYEVARAALFALGSPQASVPEPPMFESLPPVARGSDSFW